jgi:hypothetical protein
VPYWRIGDRIRRDFLQEKRAGYGQQIVTTLSSLFIREYGRGFSDKNLFRMIRFAEVIPDEQIVSTLSRQLAWSHFVAILPLQDDLQREFYAEMCRVERWSVRALRQKIAGMLLALSMRARGPCRPRPCDLRP